MYRLLIVDDEEIVLNGLENILSKISRVEVVGKMRDGLSALEFLENQDVDIVFLDIQMPKMNGLELANWISVHKPECMVVLISAYNDFSYAQKAIVYGVKNYLMKPIRLKEAKSVVEGLISECDAKKKSILWKHDFKRELIELELYHSIIDKYEKLKLVDNIYVVYAKYKVVIDEMDYHKLQLNEDLARAAIKNIFSWCSRTNVVVLTQQEKNKMYYTLLTDNITKFPRQQELKNFSVDLMGIDVEFHIIQNGNIEELLNDKKTIKQDDVADEIIIKAKKYISQNLSLNISRDDVAQHVHLDSSYFSKYFKKKAGINFHEYLQKERIKQAKEFLERGYKVQEVISKTGFTNRNYFNQIFKQYVGCSPSEYKKIGDKNA